MTTNNTKLFEEVYEKVVRQGGDGDCAVVLLTQDLKTVADEFEVFLKTTKPYGTRWQRTNNTDGDIVFWDDQESVMFSNHDRFCNFSEARLGKGYPKGKVPCSEKLVVP